MFLIVRFTIAFGSCLFISLNTSSTWLNNKLVSTTDAIRPIIPNELDASVCTVLCNTCLISSSV